MVDFFDTFITDLDCLGYLASIKWGKGVCIRATPSPILID
ncbi:hypothetical protein ADIARSV_4297 [Arcticibacter svalbardensis MN12-7]|uniref:Uncharacterized protein n=1 Tax=Arcticibacter svalbardensis MN12-7 TaxID=1150600 RepID=R9GLF5_9SPHI|nr:hypothetical protein ADIARSV_4297 [Arcticibacter svalbardensis MN12-7]